MAVKLSEAEKARIIRAPTGVLQAYDLVLRGQEERKRATRQGNAAPTWTPSTRPRTRG